MWNRFKKDNSNKKKFGLLVGAIIFLLFIDHAILNLRGCDNREVLRPLMLNSAKILERSQVKWYVDYGTLLGLLRDGDIIPWEYDNDISMMEEECEKLDELKPQFREFGYTLYNRKDFISAKQKLTYDHQTKSIIWSSPYLHTPCARIYDEKHFHYIDVYWYIPITAQQARDAPQGTYNLWPGYNFDDDIICGDEGLTQPFWPGACRRVSDVYPLKTFSYRGMELPIPRNPEKLLREYYPDSDPFASPEPKGLHKFTCIEYWYPQDYFTLGLLYLVVLYGLFFLCTNRTIRSALLRVFPCCRRCCELCGSTASDASKKPSFKPTTEAKSLVSV